MRTSLIRGNHLRHQRANVVVVENVVVLIVVIIVVVVGDVSYFVTFCCCSYYCLFLNYDVLNLFSDLLLDNNQNPSFFSEFIFNSHYMFRRSGPDHMLLHTKQNKNVQGRISLSL